MSYKFWCVCVCLCISSHLHMCSAFAFCASTQRAPARDPGPWKYLLTERWYLGGGGRIILYRETEGGREGGGEGEWG